MASDFLLTVIQTDPPPLHNITHAISPLTQAPTMSAETYRFIRHVAYRMVMPGILGLGIIGNILNIAILCKQRLQRSMDKMERCATMGFIFLAASDLTYCLFGFPKAFLTNRHFADTSKPGEMFELIYRLYTPGILNTILFSSTWCVVLIAIERYLVVTHPMKARSSVRLRRTVILQVIIPVASVVINCPHFFKYTFHSYVTPDNVTLVMPGPSEFAQFSPFRHVYFVVTNIVSTLIPVVILTYCNIQLIRAIMRSRTLGLVNIDKYSTSRITVILVAIIVLYIILVCPSTILNVIQGVYTSNSKKDKCYEFLVAIVITNVLQSVNFAINFVLYFGMHPKFRANMRCGSCSTGKQFKKRLRQYELVQVKSKCAQLTANV